MDDQQLRRLGLQLTRAGIAPRYVRRTLAELRAHREELIAQHRAEGAAPAAAAADADVQLGSVDAVLEGVLARPELRSWSHRYPWLAFALLPAGASAVAVPLVVLALVFLFDAARLVAGTDGVSWLRHRWPVDVLTHFLAWELPATVGAAWCVAAARRQVRAAWPIAGIVLVAGLGALTRVSLQWPLPGVSGQLSVEFGHPSEHAFTRFVLTTVVVLLTYLAWRRAAFRSVAA